MTDGPLDEATDLIHEIGGLMLAGSRHDEFEWVAASVVAVLHNPGRTSMHGYLYAADGTWTPDIPMDPAPFELMQDLAGAMAAPDGKQWKSALFQLDRTTHKLETQFEWDDVDRWKVSPSNFRIMPDKLKPACVTWPLEALDAPSIKGGYGEPTN